jgi:hypothetical protein
MLKEKTNILIMGTLASGASALVDMLKEYENINVLPYEFNDYRRPGFVADQLSFNSSIDYPNVIDQEISFENHKWELVYKSSIWKLFSRSAFKKVWDKDWKIKKLNDYKNSLISLYQINYLKELNKNLKSDIPFEEKIHLSNLWIKQIGNIYPARYDFTLFNQPLHPWADLDIWTKVFKPFKLIWVYRDPKDQLAEMVRRDIIFSPFRSAQLSYGQFNIVSIYGNDRKGRMKFLSDALQKRHERIDQWLRVLKHDQVLLIDFEGLVNKYDIYKSEIEQFLDITDDKHKFKNIYFNPEVALKNSIGIFSKYLSEEELADLAELEFWYNEKLSKSIHYK